MNYQRILMLTDLGADPHPACEAIRRFAPSATHVTVIAQQPPRLLAWVMPAAPPDLNDAARRTLDDLRQAAEGTAAAVNVALESELTAEAVAEAVATYDIDLVVVGSLPLRTLSLVAELRRRAVVPVLCAREAAAPRTAEGANRLLCVGLSLSGRRAVIKFLRAHGDPADRAVVLSPRPLAEADLIELREVAGIAPTVELAGDIHQPLRHLLGPEARQQIDLVVLPRVPPVVLLGIPSGPPVLILPPLRAPAREWERAIDMPDLVDDGALIRARLEYAVGIGRRTPIADQEVAFVRAAEIVARGTSRRGEVELHSGVGAFLGVLRTYGKDTADTLASVETRAAVLRAGPKNLVLFDAEIERDELSLIRTATWADPVGVRVRSIRSCSSLRAKLRAAGLPPYVIDAGAVLGEGEALDVPAQVDAVRLARTAARMRSDGFPIVAIVYHGPHQPSTKGFVAVRPNEIAALAAPPHSAIAIPTSVSTRLDMTTASETISGNRIEVELDNEKARGWLLSSIDASRQRVHLQVYMALDDDVGRPVEAALAAAGARGVTVRVLVDSLHGLHGSFGAHNPILDRLSSRPGVELRVSKPIRGPASLEDLKQRDHRKLMVVDGNVALLGGRNLSHEYYTGFGEVRLTPGTTWRVVPWLDAGARVEGPAVAALERSFLQAWTDAGGTAFDITAAAPAGTTAARVVVHRGLRDANTVEAYLALIETARSHVYAVNGFPLLLEIQHALLRALKRGVRVRTLFGNLTPRHGDTPFGGPWAAARTAATSLVHSRMDALVAAGGDCYEFVVPKQPGWDPAVGDVRPHVHAKAMSADGRLCAVGSANLDVTAGYWENELVLVVQDETIARGVEARFDQLIGASARVDPTDPEWRHRAELRGWMRYWPSVLSG
jgi:phosphatidylserine/phosphatidylglycerophosphate/cardiolipin synthase-like enzyme